MSVSLDSWESINYTVQRFFKPNLKPYYTDEYVKILLDMIGQSIGKNSFNYVTTIVSLPEPIWHTNNVIIISLPMIQYLLDQPVKLPESKIMPIKNFNIFENFNVIKNDDRRHYGANIYEHDAKNEYLVQWNDDDFSALSHDNDHNNTYTSINDTQIVTLVIIIRLTLCVAHWIQHYKLKKSITDHENFPTIELADLHNTIIKEQRESTKRGNTVTTIMNDMQGTSSDEDDDEDDDGDEDNYDANEFNDHHHHHHKDGGTKDRKKLKREKLKARCDKLKRKFGADIDKYNPSKRYRL